MRGENRRFVAPSTAILVNRAKKTEMERNKEAHRFSLGQKERKKKHHNMTKRVIKNWSENISTNFRRTHIDRWTVITRTHRPWVSVCTFLQFLEPHTRNKWKPKTFRKKIGDVSVSVWVSQSQSTHIRLQCKQRAAFQMASVQRALEWRKIKLDRRNSTYFCFSPSTCVFRR